MATILSGRKSDYGSPYAYYTVDVSVSSRAPDSVYVSVTVTGRLEYSSSWLGTGYGLTAGIYIGGSWHTWTLKSSGSSWSGTGSHSASTGFYVSVGASDTVLSGIKFRVINSGDNSAQLNETSCSSVAISSVTATYNNLQLKVSDVSQVQAKATLSGLPSAPGYARSIEWYRGGAKLGSTSIPASSAETSTEYIFTSLLPHTDYDIKAVVVYGSTTLATKTAVISTPQETGELGLVAKSTYIEAKVSGMFEEPNYERTVEFYIKKTQDSEYSAAGTVYSQGKTAAQSITGLISNVSYDVKAIIKNGLTALVTLFDTVATLKDTSLVPMPGILGITQKLGTRLCTISWITDKDVSGTIYKIQAKADGETSWTTLAQLTEIETPYVVTVHAGNTNVKFRISAENPDVAASTVNYSSEFDFYVRDDFVWDAPKIKGLQMIITATEWNRLRDYAIARNADLGNQIEMPLVRSGDMITAAIYNEMKRVISLVNDVGVTDKAAGDAIKAADIDALRIAINKTGES